MFVTFGHKDVTFIFHNNCHICSMKKMTAIFAAVLLVTACNNSVKNIKKEALGLCKHIPDIERLEESRPYLAEDFYNLLHEMVNLPDDSPVLHEWEFWFVSADGSPISSDECKVLKVRKTDAAHSIALIEVLPADSDYDSEEHTLCLEKVRGKWLICDFDSTKEAAMRRIDNK